MSRSHKVLALILVAVLSAAPLAAGWDEGVAAYQAGRYDEAAAAFSELVSRSPEAAQGHFMLGRSLYRQQQLSEAIESLGRAVELSPDQAGYGLLLAQVQLKAGQAGGALDTVARLDPAAISGQLREGFNGVLAKVADATTRDSDAYSYLERALEADSKSKSLWIALAKVAHRLDQPEKRFNALSHAFEIDPSDSELGSLAVQVAMGLAQSQEAGDPRLEWYGNASRVGLQLAAAFPTPKILQLVGGAEMGAQQYDGAIVRFGKALANGGDPLRLHYDMGRSYLAAGRYDDALQHLETALAQSPDVDLSRSIHASRGLAYRHLEQLESAAEAYRLAGDHVQATEMTGYAENRREWEAEKADCAKKRIQIAELRRDSDDLKGTAEWQELDREFTEVLEACEPYLREAEDSDRHS